MPNTTDQHSWYYPADGERDYEDTFVTFFEQLDNDVEIRDTDANKSNYDPKAGAKFVATDTEDVYLGDGNSWNHLVSTGKNPTFDSVSTDAYQINGTTVAEKDVNADLVIKNIDEAGIARLASALDVDGNDVTDSGTTVYHASTDTVGDGTTSANHASVSTDALTIGEEYRSFVGSDSVSPSSNGQQTISVSGVSTDAYVFVIFYVENAASSADVLMRINNDSSAGYDYVDADGSSSTGQSEIRVLSGSDFNNVAGTVVIGTDQLTRAGASFDIFSRISNTAAIVDRATFEGVGDPSSIQIIAGDSGTTLGAMSMTVWEATPS